MEVRETILAHKWLVNRWLHFIGELLASRGRNHDHSKFSNQEFPIFEKITPLLTTVKFGTPEYNQILKDMAPGLAEHYRQNDHHPEHFLNGIESMDLIQLLEMIVDWKIAAKSEIDFDKCAERFKIHPALLQILKNTASTFQKNGYWDIICNNLANVIDIEVRSIIIDWYNKVDIDNENYSKPDLEKFKIAKNTIKNFER